MKKLLMMKPLSLIYLLLSLLLFTACTTGKQLRTHRTELDRLAYEDLSPQQKFDGFATVVANVLDEATNLKSPLRTLRYLQRFSRQNQEEIVSLTAELETYLNSLSRIQKVSFLGRAMTRPYGFKLLSLIPKINTMMESGKYKLGPLERTLTMFALKQMQKQD